MDDAATGAMFWALAYLVMETTANKTGRDLVWPLILIGMLSFHMVRYLYFK